MIEKTNEKINKGRTQQKYTEPQKLLYNTLVSGKN